MSKRVQYAQSLPVLSANPTAEAGRTVFYALSDGLYARLETGVILGPFGVGGGATVVGGAIPASRVALPTPSSVQMGATGLGGTFEDVPGLSTTVTSAAAVPLFVLTNLAVSTVTGNSAVEVGVRVVVDSVPEQQGNATRVIIPRSAELNATSASMLTAALPAGTYTARVQWRRVSGSFVPEITTGSTFLQAQQAPKGDKGDPGTGGGSSAVFQPEPPTSPQLNDIWYDTDETAPVPTGGFPVPIAFHVGGVLTTGVKRPRFLAPVPLTVKHAYGRISAGNSDANGPTYRLVRSSPDGVTTVTSTETSGAVPATTVLHDFVDFDLDAGDSLRVEVVAIGAAAPEDLSVTVYAVTR